MDPFYRSGNRGSEKGGQPLAGDHPALKQQKQIEAWVSLLLLQCPFHPPWLASKPPGPHLPLPHRDLLACPRAIRLWILLSENTMIPWAVPSFPGSLLPEELPALEPLGSPSPRQAPPAEAMTMSLRSLGIHDPADPLLPLRVEFCPYCDLL